MTDDLPLISVVMSVYNDALYLREAVKSVLEQSFSDFEFIIIDDCSTDNSFEILQEFEKEDGRIRLIHNDVNCGLTVSLNKGIKLARGEFVARMDGDDISDKSRFEKQVLYMQEYSDCVALSGQVAFIDSDGLKFGESCNSLDHNGIEEKLWEGFGSALVHAAVMFRKDALNKVGGYRIEAGHSEDLDLYLRLGEVGRLANLPDVIFSVRRHCKSVTAIGGEKKDSHKNAQKAQERRLVILREAAERRGLDAGKIELFDFPMPGTRAEWHADIAWRAYKQGYDEAARKHARLAVRCGPFGYQAWRACLYLGTGIGRRVLAQR
jgi:glycosyltransferase involved in cell wall biosynthesis